jgi:hypothetical protein
MLVCGAGEPTVTEHKTRRVNAVVGPCEGVKNHHPCRRLHIHTDDNQDHVGYAISANGESVALGLADSVALISFNPTDLKLATCMALHERLGSSSPLACLTAHVLELVWEYVPGDPCSDEATQGQPCASDPATPGSGRCQEPGANVAASRAQAVLSMSLSPSHAECAACLVVCVAGRRRMGASLQGEGVVTTADGHMEVWSNCAHDLEGEGLQVVYMDLPKNATLW